MKSCCFVWQALSASGTDLEAFWTMALKDGGLEARPVVLLFTDTQIRGAAGWQQLSDFLQYGEVPNVLSTVEKKEVAHACHCSLCSLTDCTLALVLGCASSSRGRVDAPTHVERDELLHRESAEGT
jgi:hypothetical protein